MQLCAGILFSLALIMGLAVVNGQDIGKCIDGLTQQVTNNPNAICLAMSDYMKCMMRELNMVDLGLTSSNIQMLESQLNSQLSASGVSCDIDIQQLYNELKDEERRGVTSGPTQKPASFEDATTIGECIQALTNAAIAKGGITCADADPYIKCMVRVLELHKQSLSDSDIAQFEDQVESELRKQNVNCQLNVREMINDLRDIPAMEIGSPEFVQCARDNSQNMDSPTCEELEATARCLLQVEDAYKYVNNRQRDALQQAINNNFPNCRVSIAGIQSEMKGNGAEGIRASVVFSMAVTVVSLLLARLF